MVKYKISKQLKMIIGIIFIALFILVCIIGNSLNNKKPAINNTFIKTKLHTNINSKVAFSNLELAHIEVESIQQYMELNFKDYECVYIHNGALVFYTTNDKIDIELLESINYLRLLENTNSNIKAYINTYSGKELTDKLFNSDFDSINIFSYTNLLGSVDNYIPEDTYKQDILKALQGDTDLISAYFENDALTEETSNYLKEKINDNINCRVLIGKSNNNEINIDRICILGLNTSDDSNIELKVILKLNKHQKVYDIDIY